MARCILALALCFTFALPCVWSRRINHDNKVASAYEAQQPQDVSFWMMVENGLVLENKVVVKESEAKAWVSAGTGDTRAYFGCLRHEDGFTFEAVASGHGKQSHEVEERDHALCKNAWMLWE